MPNVDLPTYSTNSGVFHVIIVNSKLYTIHDNSNNTNLLQLITYIYTEKYVLYYNNSVDNNLYIQYILTLSQRLGSALAFKSNLTTSG